MDGLIDWSISEEDYAEVAKATQRAEIMARKAKRPFDIKECEMDLTAVHLNDTALDLVRLNEFDDFNFAHDVFGIQRHIDRTNGKLTRCFMPRCARRD